MKISKIISKLKSAQQEFGDLPVSTWDGIIINFELTPSCDGCVPSKGDKIDEISLEIICE